MYFIRPPMEELKAEFKELELEIDLKIEKVKEILALIKKKDLSAFERLYSFTILRKYTIDEFIFSDIFAQLVILSNFFATIEKAFDLISGNYKQFKDTLNNLYLQFDKISQNRSEQ
jgi:hypothetical protein